VQCELGGRQRRGLGPADPQCCKLALATWNVTSLVGKEPEWVCEVERYQLDIVGLTSTQCWLWNQTPGEGLDSLIIWCCPWTETLGRCWDTVLSGDSHVLLGDFNGHVGNDGVTFRGMMGGSESKWSWSCCWTSVLAMDCPSQTPGS